MIEFKKYSDDIENTDCFVLIIPRYDLNSFEFTKSEKILLDAANSPFASCSEIINAFQMILRKIKDSYENPKIKEIHYRNYPNGQLIWGDSLIFRSLWKVGDTLVHNYVRYSVKHVEIKDQVLHVYLTLVNGESNG